MDTIHEQNRVPVIGSYDVVVLGGGIAGVAAAVAAARGGARTLLVEKSVSLGGLATIGLINIYLPLCDGLGRKLTGGIAEELLRLSIAHGYHTLDPAWMSGEATAQARYRTSFNPCEFIIDLDAWVADAGVDLRFDTAFCRPVMEDGCCTAVIVEEKGGRAAYRCRAAVDATGDADAMDRAGARCVEGRNWLSSWCFISDWKPDLPRARETQVHIDNYRLHTVRKGSRGSLPRNAGPYRGLTGEEVTRFVTDGRRLIRESVDDDVGTVMLLPTMADLCTTRCIGGVRPLTPEDDHRHTPDSIGCVGDWRKAGPVYEVPFASLYDPAIGNMLAAGRCTAAQGDAWEITRVIPSCALTGQAAGTAASMVALTGRCLPSLPAGELQQRLSDAGVMIHF